MGSNIIRAIIAVLLVAIIGFSAWKIVMPPQSAEKQAEELTKLIAQAMAAVQDQKSADADAAMQRMATVLKNSKNTAIKLKFTPALAELYAQTGQIEKGETFLNEYVKFVEMLIPQAKSPEDRFTFQQCLVPCMNYFLHVGKLDKMETVLQKYETCSTEGYSDIQKIHVKMDLADNCAAIGQFGKAREYFTQVEPLLENLPDAEKAELMPKAVKTNFYMKQFDEALRYANETEKIILATNPPQGAVILRSIATIRNEISKMKAADGPAKEPTERTIKAEEPVSVDALLDEFQMIAPDNMIQSEF